MKPLRADSARRWAWATWPTRPGPPPGSPWPLGHLRPGNRVLVYTDGVTEARAPGGELVGRERPGSSPRGLYTRLGDQPARRRSDGPPSWWTVRSATRRPRGVTIEVLPRPRPTPVTHSAPVGEPVLHISLASGQGTGPTPMAAFDAALCAAGVGEFNLVRLSSVIPPHARLEAHDGSGVPSGRWGDRLYCVYASQIAERPGEQAWAGIGWVLRDDGSGAGLFVEHEGPVEQGVRDDLRSSLADMTARRGGGWTQPRVLVNGTMCLDGPACALVVAAYETKGWDRAQVR